MRLPSPLLQGLLSLIPVSWERQIFGREREAGVQVAVPLTYSEPQHPCAYSTSPFTFNSLVTANLRDPSSASRSHGFRLRVFLSHSSRVTTRWFDIWAEAVAVGAMCIVRGHGGTSTLAGGLNVVVEPFSGRSIDGG